MCDQLVVNFEPWYGVQQAVNNPVLLCTVECRELCQKIATY